MANKSTTTTVRIPCSKCDGRGEYLHHGHCFRCDGRGYHTMSAARHAAMLAGKAKWVASCRAYAAAEEAAEAAIHAFYLDACVAVAAGVAAARAWFKAHASNAGALAGLINAMRDRQSTAWDERSNAIARYMADNRATLDRSLTVHQGF